MQSTVASKAAEVDREYNVSEKAAQAADKVGACACRLLAPGPRGDWVALHGCWSRAPTLPPRLALGCWVVQVKEKADEVESKYGVLRRAKALWQDVQRKWPTVSMQCTCTPLCMREAVL